ncbi:UNVERIFIED_CONTAM: hypothetical protein FKN15_047931 [Acipenser sinensis]
MLSSKTYAVLEDSMCLYRTTQLTGKPAGARPVYRGRWCAVTGSWLYLNAVH